MKKTISFGLIAVLSAFVLLGAYALPEYGENAKVSSENSVSGKVESVKGVSEVEEIETEVREVESEKEDNDFKYIPIEQVNLGDGLEQNGTNGTNTTMPGNNTNMTNFTFVSGCNTLSPEILNTVAQLQSLGHIIVKQELNNVNTGRYFLIPGGLFRVQTIVNSSAGFGDDEVIFRDSIGGEIYEGTIISEGVGIVVIGGQTYSFTYVKNLGDEGYVKVDFPQTPVGQIMTFNCNFVPFPTNNVTLAITNEEVLQGQNMMFIVDYPENYATFSNTGFNFEITDGINVVYLCEGFTGNNSCDFLTSTAFIQNGIVHRALIMNTSGFEAGRYFFVARALYGEQTFGFSSNVVSGRILPNDLVGDINHDGRVNELDLAILTYVYGQQHTGEADLNGDGRVDFVDLNLLLSNWTNY